MRSYTQLIYHVVFAKKDRRLAITKNEERRLYTYIWNLLKAIGCHVYRIGGIEDHIHILTDIHQSLALSDVKRDIKANSSRFIRENNLFPKFEGWQAGYGAFTCSYEQLNILTNYIKNQKEHHKKMSSKEELRNILKEHNIDYDEQYFQ